MKIKKYGLAGFCIMMAVIVAFCYSKQQETVIVGINLALSGENQAQGEATERGIVLAKNQLNKRGGLLGRPVKLVSVDNHGKPNDAAMAVQQLNMRHTAAIIGPNIHDCAVAAVPDILDKKIPMISPAGVQPDITVDMQQKTVYPYVFRTAFLNAQQGETMAAYAMEACSAQRTAVLYENTAYSQELASHFKDAIERHGGKVLVYQDVSGDVDTSAVIAALKAQSCQAVYLPVSQEQAAVWIPSLRDAGIGCPVLGPDSWQGELLAAGLHADYLRRVFYAAQYATDAKDPVSEDFAEEYYEMYGELPDSYAALGYDAFMLLAKAAENGQSVKREDIAAQLQQLREYQGVTGCMLFDGQHNPVKPVCILTFWENEPAFLEKQQAADI